MLQHSCAPHNCSAPHSVVYSARDMCVWFHWLHLTSFTLLVFELTPRIRRRSVCNPQSTCRFVRMVYVYLLVIKSIDSFVPFYLALMTHETLSLSRLTQTQFRFDSQFWSGLFKPAIHSIIFRLRFYDLCRLSTDQSHGMSFTFKFAHILVFIHTSNRQFDCRQSPVDGKCQPKFNTYIVRGEYKRLRRPL